MRAYYWKAAIKMFLENPFTGIGLDRYQFYFKAYREVGYPLKYGFDITSSNAHNVYLQMLSTGGFLLFFSYFSITVITILFFYKAIKKNKDLLNDNLTIPVFAGWVTFQAQSLISIDHLALSVYGWLFSAVIIKKSIEPLTSSQVESQIISNRSTRNLNLVGPIVTGVGFLICFIMIQPIAKPDALTLQIRGLASSVNMNSEPQFQDLTKQLVASKFVDQYNKLLVGSLLMQKNQVADAEMIFKSVADSDPISYDALNNLALIYEYKQEYAKAILIRKQLMTVDPWGAKNMYLLALDLKSINDRNQMIIVRNQILAFASQTEYGKLAKDNLS